MCGASKGHVVVIVVTGIFSAASVASRTAAMTDPPHVFCLLVVALARSVFSADSQGLPVDIIGECSSQAAFKGTVSVNI